MQAAYRRPYLLSVNKQVDTSFEMKTFFWAGGVFI
jgi:hypothetical protein